MKCTAKITSKGQITLPADVRRDLGVGPGDSVIFEREGDVVRVRPKRPDVSPFEEYRGIGNEDIPSGIENIIRYFREMRGHDPNEDEWEQRYAEMEKAAQAKKSA